jgi:hypothetical protein
MIDGDAKPPTALGFLTVLEHQQQGLVGGYLILNTAGRPLEFHCTAPVKPSRAQQILFGPTLEPYLYGEQIGQTLLAKGSMKPLAVCTNVEAVLSVRDFVSLPIALVLRADEQVTQDESRETFESLVWRVDAPRSAPHLNTFAIGRNTLAVPPDRAADRQAIAGRMEALAEFDLSEPFERIREAVEEAHKGTRA